VKKAVLYAAGFTVPEDPAQQDELYNNSITEVRGDDGNISYYEISRVGRPGGFVFPASGPGLWGEIAAVIGFDEGLNLLTGIDFTQQNETPGLGARISEEWFKLQFRGKTGPFTRVPEGTESDSPIEFDAITGATITSTAVQKIVNSTIDHAPSILGRE
jgi:Na+-transporting NADH:ubiquinone oxidoreductase subunit C